MFGQNLGNESMAPDVVLFSCLVLSQQTKTK